MKISHENFLETLDYIPNPTLLFDKDGTLHYCNQSMLTFFGCEKLSQLQENQSYYFKEIQIKNKNIFENILFAIRETLANGSYELDFDLSDYQGNCCTMLVNGTTYENSSQLMALFTLTNINNITQKIIPETALVLEDIPISFETICEVSPLALNLWTPQSENILCNQRAATLFDLESKQQYLDDFFKLSPEYQPNGVLSSELALRHINYASKEGYNRFYWLHCKLDGTEIPCEITLSKVTASNGEVYVLGFTRDLRSEFEESDNEENDYYFHNKYSDRKLFNTIVELSSEWFFVLDLRTDVIQYYGNLIFNHFGTYRISKPIKNAMSDGFIHPEDCTLYQQLIENFRSDKKEELELRILQKNGSYRYYSIIYRVIHDALRKPIFAVGKGLDIHDQKQLVQRSQLDLLSQCYNKVSGEYLMKEKLDSYNEKNQCALLMIDIDDFKIINDNLGHLVGDGVIKDIADQLRSIFRKNDIVSRAGGDEFMVFMDDISDLVIIEKKAQSIVNQCRLTYKGHYKNYTVSTSIGISCSIDVGSSYEELYKAADKALYQSKLKGKNCYTTYIASLMDVAGNLVSVDNLNRAMSAYLDHDLISSMFELLYQDYDSIQVIDKVLGYIGQKYNVDRCYIIETFDSGQTYTNTYEWCSNGTPSGKADLQNVSFDFLEDLFTRARSRLVYSNRLEHLFSNHEIYNTMHKHGVLAFAHAHVKKDNYVSFYIGLDDCTNTRAWEQRELSTLRYIGKITSLFLRGNTAREHLQEIEDIDT